MQSEKEKLILICILLLAVFLISFRFLETPSVWVDEGIFTETARNLALHGELGIQAAPGKIVPSGVWATSGFPLLWPVAGSFSAFGIGLWQARLPMLLYMFILVALFYLFIKERYGFYPAVLSVLLLLSFSPFYGNGRPVQGEVPGLVFLVLGALLFLYFENSRYKKVSLAILSGLSFGLCAAAKPLYLMTLLPALAVVFIVFRKKIGWRSIFILVFAILLPVILWVFTQFPTVGLMKEAVSLYLSGNPDASANSIQMMKINFLRFFTESTPILFLIILIFIAASFWKKGKKYSVAEFVLFSFVIFNWLAYLKGPGWYRHFFPAHTILYLLLPGAVLFFKSYFSNDTLRKVLTFGVVLLVGLQFYHLVFLSQTSFVVERNRNKEASSLLSNIGPDKKVFFINTIEAVIFLKHSNYSQYIVPSDFLSIGKEEFGRWKNFRDADYVLLYRSEAEKYGASCPCYDDIASPTSRYVFLKKK